MRRVLSGTAYVVGGGFLILALTGMDPDLDIPVRTVLVTLLLAAVCILQGAAYGGAK